MASNGSTASMSQQPETLRVASSTPMSGHFFTDMWGNNTSDIDVRTLIHGYATVAWVGEGDCAVDPTVVKDLVIADMDGNRTYEFTLQEGLTYNDGTPITAADYAFSVLMLADPRVTGLGAVPSTYEHLLGFDAYVKAVDAATAKNSGKPIKVPFSGVRLLDTYRFSITVSRQYLPYFYELALANAQPYPIHVIAPGCEIRDEGLGAYIAGPLDSPLIERTVLDTATGYLYYPRVTCGPYALLSYDDGAHVATLERNERYIGNFEGKTPVFARLEYSFANPETMLEDLRTGKIDILHKVSNGSRIEQGRESASLEEIGMVSYPRAGFAYLSFACEQGVAASSAVRKAVAMCVDVEALCMEAHKGFGMPVYGYYGMGQWMVGESQEALKSMAQSTFSIEAAREALKADGWNLNASGQPYDVQAGGTRYRSAADGTLEELVIQWAIPGDSEIAQALAAMLRETAPQAGIRIVETPLPFDELLSHYYRQVERTYDMFFGASNFLLAFDPYHAFHTDALYQGVFNTTGISDKRLMELALDMRKTKPGNRDEYKEKWLAFQARWMDVLPAVPLYSNTYFDFFRNDLQDYSPNASWSWANTILHAYIGEPAAIEVPVGEDAPADEGGFIWLSSDGESLWVDD